MVLGGDSGGLAGVRNSANSIPRNKIFMTCPLCENHEALIQNAVRMGVNATLAALSEALKNKLWMNGVSESSIALVDEEAAKFRQ